MGNSGSRDCQRASRSALKDFTKDVFQVFSGGNCWYCLGVGRVMALEGVSGEVGELSLGWCSLLVGLRSSSQYLGQLGLMLREFWRIS